MWSSEMLRTKDLATPRPRCLPEQVRQRKTPLVLEIQAGCLGSGGYGCAHSKQRLFSSSCASCSSLWLLLIMITAAIAYCYIRMKLPSELFCWLKGLRLLDTKDFQALAPLQLLEEPDAKAIFHGLTVLRLIDRVCAIKKVEYLQLHVDQRVPVFSKPKMMLNWKAAFGLLPKLGLGMDAEQLRLILAGDEDMMVDVLEAVYRRFGKKVDLQEQDELETLKALGLSESRVDGGPAEPARAPSGGAASRPAGSSALVPIGMHRAKSSMLQRAGATKHDSLYIKPNLPTLNSSTITRNFTMAGSKLNLADFNLNISTQLIPLNIQHIEQTRPRPQDISHLFEFLLVTAADALKMRVSSVVPLFAGGGKVLANLIVKGVKYEGFKGLVDWFALLAKEASHIFEMALMDDSWSTLRMFFSTIKPGLISKSPEVAELALGLFLRLFVLLKEKNKLAAA